MRHPLPQYTLVDTLYQGARTRGYRVLETDNHQPDELLRQLVQIILQHSGGDYCALCLPVDATRTDEWHVRVTATPDQVQLGSAPLQAHPELPVKLMKYVRNKQETLVIYDLETDLPVLDDYLRQHRPKSLLGLPIFNQGRLIGLLYLQNRVKRGLFTDELLSMLNFLCAQISMSFENSRLYQQAQEDRRRLTALMSNLPGMAYVAINDEHWTMQFASEGCYDLTGYTSEELINNRAIDFGRLIYDEDAEDVGLEVEAAIAARRPYKVVYRIRTKQGEEKWPWEQGQAIFDENDKPTLLEGLIIDISDRKSAEIALGEREAHYRALVSAIPDLIMRATRDGIHLDWAASSETKVLGDIDDFEGKHVTELVPQEPAQQRLQAIQRALETQSTEVYEQTLMIEGEQQQEEVRVVPYAEDEVLLLVRDISDRKRAEAAVIQKSQDLEKALADLQNTQLQLVQGEKMSALGGLVAGVAHEINNPVGCIIGNVGATQDYISDLLGLLDLYADELPNPSEQLEEELETVDLDYVREDLPKLIRAMKDSGERIKSISKSLRTFSRADQGTKQVFNLHEGIDSTVLILRHRLKANDQRPAIEVIKDYDNLPDIACFPGQLNQVFMNILANAVDALDEVSQGQGFADLTANPHRITIRTERGADQVKVSISDNGPGMPAETKAKIFEHLFTTKGVGKGTGLGLAIARQIIDEVHGGTLDVTSTIGQGSEFIMTLPIAG